MHNSAYIASTPIRTSKNGADALEQLLAKHFEHYPVSLEVDEVLGEGVVVYRVAMEPREVPPSFVDRVEGFCSEVSDQASWEDVMGPFEIQLREDLMNDERDQFFYSGPSAADVAAFAAECRVRRALECLAPCDELARNALIAVLGAAESNAELAVHDRPVG